MSLRRCSKNIVVHRLHHSDQGEICDHFQRLDAQSRRLRFCGAVSDAGITKYADNIFCHDSIVSGVEIDGKLRGVVELRGAFQSWSPTAEAAFSVETEWQNMGIGDALFGYMFALAQNRAVKTIQMMCLKENNTMCHLAAKHHALLRYDHGEVEAVLHPYWPTPASMAKEIMGETRGYARNLFG